jgi:hypothetical protein
MRVVARNGKEVKVNWRDLGSRVLRRDDILFLPPSARTVSQEEMDALEAKRIRRLRELGQWRPSNGWQIEPAL